MIQSDGKIRAESGLIDLLHHVTSHQQEENGHSLADEPPRRFVVLKNTPKGSHSLAEGSKINILLYQ
jgi:hypothetical protein